MDAQDQRRVAAAGILRLTSWATAATVALTLATLASLTPSGSERIAGAIGALSGEPLQATQIAARKAELETDRRSMNDALRLLAADRDRLITRVASLERNLDDITGSIKSPVPRPLPENYSLQNPPPFDPMPPNTADTSPSKTDDGPPWTSRLPDFWPHASPGNFYVLSPGALSVSPSWPTPSVRVAALADSQPITPTIVSRTEFGVDIGSGSDLAEIRSLWNAAKSQHGKLIGNLRPIVVRREDRAGNSDYRLVIGPLANAGAAAKLCATLGAADIMCSTRPYQGERLAP